MSITRRQALRSIAAAAALPLAAKAAIADGHATEHTVIIKDFSFNPASIEIAAGDTITWINEDGSRHSATDLNGAFDTGLLARGEMASLKFGASGEFNYRCTPHGNMRGTIVVR